MEHINWSPGVGDPGFMGWFTVGMYFLCAFGAFNLWRKPVGFTINEERKQKVFWMLVFILMLLMGINKQLDLQSLFTEMGRYLSYKQGWYQNRKGVQKLFIYSVVILGGLSMVTLMFVFKSILKNNILAILGLGVVIVFVLCRASSFHGMDIFINSRLLGLKMNWIMELGGIILILSNILKIHYSKSTK